MQQWITLILTQSAGYHSTTIFIVSVLEALGDIFLALAHYNLSDYQPHQRIKADVNQLEDILSSSVDASY